MVKSLPPKPGGVSSIPARGPKIPYAEWLEKTNQTKAYKNRSNNVTNSIKNFKMVHIKKILKKKKKRRALATSNKSVHGLAPFPSLAPVPSSSDSPGLCAPPPPTMPGQVCSQLPTICAPPGDAPGLGCSFPGLRFLPHYHLLRENFLILTHLCLSAYLSRVSLSPHHNPHSRFLISVSVCGPPPCPEDIGA